MRSKVLSDVCRKLPAAALLWGCFLLALTTRLDAQSYGLTSRAPIGPYLDGRLPSSAPNPATGWSAAVAFPNLTFRDPTFLIPEPNSNRLYVGTLWGVVYHFVNDPNTTTRTVFLDVSNRTQVSDSSGLLGMAFHPDFRKTGSPNRGYVYVAYQYSPNPVYGYQPSYNRLSRFTVPDGATAVDPTSELVLIDQYDPEPWHNGGDLFFGDDGFLYLSLGDGGGANDSFGFSQKLNGGLFGGVLRIDVNRDPTKSHPIRRQPQSSDPSRPSFTGNYYIPNDNPFLDPGGSILEEFWAIGLRSPHRMTYDPIGKRIWVGDVGQTTIEEIDVIEKAGNYQWPYREGNIAGPKPKPEPLIGVDQPPIYTYPVGDGNNCVIGGYVYRGRDHASLLDGKYIFGDNGSGRIWAMTYDSGTPSVVLLCNMPAGSALTGLSSFGVDHDGEIYMCQMGPSGRIYKLARSGSSGPAAPPLLSQTGVFSNLSTLTPAAALVPYDVNSPLWSDNAHKRRWMAVPNDGAPYGTSESIGFSRTGHWTFPNGTVFVKHFELPIDETNPNLVKRLETRLLVRDNSGGVYGVTYKWRDDNSDADLLPGSLNEDITIRTASGGTRTQTWSYPSPQACLSCHTANANHVLGLSTRQLNGDHAYPTGTTDNQLRTLNRIAMLIPAINEADIPAMDKLAPVTSSTASLEHKVRSYLDANCAHCHRPGGARAFFDARFDTPLSQQQIIDGPVANALGIDGAHVVTPESVIQSIMHRRMNTNEGIRMPPLARNVIDTAAVDTLEEWILSLRASELPAPWTNGDVGFVGFAGAVRFSNGTYTVNGSGSDIAGTADAFHYVYQPWTGDGEIVARVTSIQNTDTWAKAGVMFRETLEAGARNAFVASNPAGTTLFQHRTTTNGSSTSVSGFNSLPRWLRLVRAGSTFRGFHSSDGVNWTQISSVTIDLPATIFVGLAVTSHQNNTLCAATFESVSVSGSGGTPTAPAAPTTLAATVASSSQINLSWTDNANNEEGFKIERSTAGGAFSQIATVGANVTTYSSTGLAASTSYSYRVRATRGGVDSSYSNTATATTSAPPAIPAPTNLTATATSSSQINLSWTDNSSSESGFKVERSTDGVSFTQIATTAANATSFSNTGLTAATTYWYRVRATTSTGDSAFSNIASATTPAGDTPPPGWTPADIGNVAIAGSQELSGSNATVRASGTDIWESADGFRFVYRSLNGDGSILARVASLTNTHSWAKAGVMIRESLAAGSPNVAMLVTAANGVAAQHRATANGSTVSTSGPWGVTAPYWVRLVRTGNTIVASGSADGSAWTTIATYTTTMNSTALIGLAVTSHNNSALTTAVFEQIALDASSGTPTAPAAPTNLVATAVSSSRIDLTWTDNANNEAGFEIERSTDGANFTQIATAAANATAYSNTGLTASTAYTYRVRATNAAGDSAFSNTASATTAAPTAPAAPSNLIASAVSSTEIALSWTDNATNEDGFRIERSTDGVSFTQIATTTANATSYSNTGLTPSTAYTYRVRATLGTTNSAFSNTASATTPAGPGPTPDWTGLDIGTVGNAGSQTFSGDTITVRGGGTDIWNTADGFRFLYRPLTGDGAIEARVVSMMNTHSWAKAGVMIREALTPGARNTAALLTAANGIVAQNRSTTNSTTASIGGPWGARAPYWVRLARTGNTVVAATSSTGANWNTVATFTVSMNSTVYIGLAVCSHTTTALNTVTFDNVTVSGTSTPTLPAAPTNLTATAVSSTRVDLTWTDNSTNEEGFKIERATDGVNFTQVATVAANATAFSNTGLTSGATYTYRVRAAHSAGDSAFSNTASATTSATPPAAPSSLTATAVASYRIDLAWTDNAANEAGFKIERSFDGASFSQIATVGANVTSYSNQGLVGSLTYTYRVRANNAAGDSTYSNTAAATTSPSDGGSSAPSELRATAFSSSQINLTWRDNTSDEEGFKIERTTDGVSFTQIAVTAANATTFSDTGLTPATKYAYRVRAAMGPLNSGYSNAATATTPATAPTWSHADVGAVGLAGSDDASGNTITVRGSGSDIWENADAFRFLYRTLTGDCTIEAQVTSLTNTHAWAKAGVMIRETLAPDARNVYALLTPTNGLAVQIRASSGGTTTMSPGPWGITAPHWVRLVRTGNTIVAAASPDGVAWTTIATHTVTMGATVHVGFAVTSHDNTKLNTAVFTDPFIQQP